MPLSAPTNSSLDSSIMSSSKLSICLVPHEDRKWGDKANKPGGVGKVVARRASRHRPCDSPGILFSTGFILPNA